MIRDNLIPFNFGNVFLTSLSILWNKELKLADFKENSLVTVEEKAKTESHKYDDEYTLFKTTYGKPRKVTPYNQSHIFRSLSDPISEWMNSEPLFINTEYWMSICLIEYSFVFKWV